MLPFILSFYTFVVWCWGISWVVEGICVLSLLKREKAKRKKSIITSAAFFSHYRQLLRFIMTASRLRAAWRSI